MLKQYFGINDQTPSLAEQHVTTNDVGYPNQSLKVRPRSSTVTKKKVKTQLEDPENTADQFIVLTHVNLAATSMIVIIRQKHSHLVSNIKSDTLKLGTMGFMANKGAVNINFRLGDHEVMLINCHLEAHEENRLRRNE